MEYCQCDDKSSQRLQGFTAGQIFLGRKSSGQIFGCRQEVYQTFTSTVKLINNLVHLQITESGYWCGAVFVLSTFYKPREIAMRNSIFYCGNWLSGALGGAFAGAIISGKYKIYVYICLCHTTL